MANGDEDTRTILDVAKNWESFSSPLTRLRIESSPPVWVSYSEGIASKPLLRIEFAFFCLLDTLLSRTANAWHPARLNRAFEIVILDLAQSTLGSPGGLADGGGHHSTSREFKPLECNRVDTSPMPQYSPQPWLLCRTRNSCWPLAFKIRHIGNVGTHIAATSLAKNVDRPPIQSPTRRHGIPQANFF